MLDQLIQLFNQGRLTEAIELGNQGAASQPRDLPLRLVLVQLVCFTGDWTRVERIVKQMELLDSKQEHLALTNFVDRMVMAERQRKSVWTEGLVPEFSQAPDEATQKLLWAWSCRRSGDLTQYADSLQWVLENAPPMSLVIGDTTHDGLRDMDDMTCTILEAHTMQGTYFWIPLQSIARIDVAKPTRPVDHLWSRARLSLTDGSDLLAFLPGLYFHSFGAGVDDQLKLGRQTAWHTDEQDQEIGLGRRSFVAGDSDFTYFDFQHATLIS